VAPAEFGRRAQIHFKAAGMNSIGVLVVDDSALIREIICDTVREQPGMHVVGAAVDGREALEMAAQFRPDVVTLDVQMPKMDGLTTLDELLKIRPLPVIMVSSLTKAGAETTLQALDRGAMDYVGKPDSGTGRHRVLGEELIRKIRMMSGVDVTRMLRIRCERLERARKRTLTHPSTAAPTHAASSVATPAGFAEACIALGISTGGPPALTTLFEALQPPLPPMLVIQHMPPNFTKAFAWRLNSLSPLSVKEAKPGDVLEPNHVFVAPGDKHLSIRRQDGRAVVHIDESDPVSGHRPSVDVMMRSAAEVYGSRVLGVIMTGIGRDGSDGCRSIRSRGGYVIGQDEATSDVYGMNKVAMVEGNVDRQFGLDEGSNLIMGLAAKLPARGAPAAHA
jgi:two-component system, chemotaxis family, protein-glutamate methylesterase/glutaminase